MNYNDDDLTLLDLTQNSKSGLYEDPMTQGELRSISRRYFYMFVFVFLILITLSSVGFALFQEDTQTELTILKTKNNISNTIQAYKSVIKNTQNTASIIKNEIKAYTISEEDEELQFRRNRMGKLLVSAPSYLINGLTYHYIVENNGSILIIKGDISKTSDEDFKKMFAYMEVSKTINSILNADNLNLSFKQIIVASDRLSLIYPLKKEDVQATIINSFDTKAKIFSDPTSLATKLSESGDMNFVTSPINKNESLNISYSPKKNIFNFRYKLDINKNAKLNDNVFIDYQEKSSINSSKTSINGEVVGDMYVVDHNSNILYSSRVKDKTHVLFNLAYLMPSISLEDIQDKKDKQFFGYKTYQIYKENLNEFDWNFIYVIPHNYWREFISQTSYLVFAKTFVLGLLFAIIVSVFVYLLFVRPSYVLSKLLLAIFDSQQESRALRNLVINENKFLLGAWYKWFLKVNQIVYKIVSDYNILYQVMNYDEETQLPNEKHFRNTLKELTHNLKDDEKLIVAIFTLREFDDIIKIFDITGADAIIQTIAFRLKTIFGTKDFRTFARFSLYKFAIAFSVKKKLDRIAVEKELAELMKDIVSTITIRGQSISLKSVLVYTEILDSVHLDDHIEFALVNFLNRTYNNAENIKRYIGAETVAIEHNMVLYNKLHDTIVNKDMIYHYQPQIDTRTGKMVGVEAFMRWNVDGKILPSKDFVPFINDTGILSTMSLKLIDASLKDLQLFIELTGNKDLVMSINLSTRQALNTAFMEHMLKIIADHKVDFKNIGVEITEDVLLPNESLQYVGLQELHEKGVHISVSNFGATSLPLADLSKTEYSECKISREVIRNINTPQGKNHFKAIASLINELQMKSVVVEGVQDIDTILEVQKSGFHIMQSYFLCPPMPFDELSERIAKGFRKV